MIIRELGEKIQFIELGDLFRVTVGLTPGLHRLEYKGTSHSRP